MATSDDPLVAAVRRGEMPALAEFLTARHAPLLAYVERQLGAALRRKLEPDDILQEVSADAVRGLAQVDLTTRDPFGWLCQLAERRIIDAHRRYIASQKRAAGREQMLGQFGGDTSRLAAIDQLAASLTSASEAFARNARADRLVEALATLPDDMQRALELRYVRELPSKEIARQMGKTDGAVRVLLTRSLHRLQAVLGSPDGEGG